MTRSILFLIALTILLSCNGQKPAEGQGSKISSPYSAKGKTIVSYVTADSTKLKLSLTGTLHFTELKETKESRVYVFVDPDKTFQTFLGIGAALTDAAAETFAKLPAARKKEFLTSYYDAKNGIGYTLARTNINSCDFSSGSYTYVTEGDIELKSFSIDHDRQFKIPLIKEAMSAAGGKLTLFASPWSPPAFMKSNNDMLHGGTLKPGYFQSWANYYTKFIKSYEKEGIPVWGITIQNEPMATQKWESCIYSAEEERDFLKNFLGPTMVREGLGDKKIIIWDHNRDMMVQRAEAMFSDPEASKYAWGMGFHWYEDWTGGTQMYDNVGIVHAAYPDKNLIFTEGCAERFNPSGFYYRGLGEEYGRSIINDFNNGTVAWTDWNILLDENGGPNHVGNFCFAPVHANTKTGELIYTSSYYYIGHFSKFIRPGAKRIVSSASRSLLLTTAFINPDGSVVVVVMNDSNKETAFNLTVGRAAAELASLPHSIMTMVF
jgi:glucosylceramidase